MRQVTQSGNRRAYIEITSPSADLRQVLAGRDANTPVALAYPEHGEGVCGNLLELDREIAHGRSILRGISSPQPLQNLFRSTFENRQTEL